METACLSLSLVSISRPSLPPMAPPAARWSDSGAFPVKLLLLILVKLQCLADRVSFAAVCRHWRSAHELAERDAQPPPRQIPWLLFPSPVQAPSISSFLSGARRLIYLPDDLRGARLCGSYPGGWLAAALGPCGAYLLANIFSGAKVPLPDRLSHPWLQSVTPAIISAVILSAAPTSPNCLAAAVVCGTSNIAFCRPGVDRYWTSGEWEISWPEDMVYYDGEVMQGFHAVTGSGKVWTFTPTDGQADTAMVLARPYTAQEHMTLMPPSTSVARYLAVSRGRLLMVERYYSRSRSRTATFLFRVFEMEAKTLPNGRHKASWVELEGLDGRVLFLGRGCSRAFEVSKLHGFKGDSIYFLDDTKFDLSLVMKSQGEYPCSDMGIYSVSDVVLRPGLHPPTVCSNMPSPIYGTQTSLAFVKCIGNNYIFFETNVGNSHVVIFEKIREGNNGAEHNESNMTGTFWSFPSELLSKPSPPVWFAP